jgi:1-acyl-sn-glycerol-3-phosphate acyltransferase
MMYRILRFIVGLGLRIYYREIRIIHRERIPEGKPLVIIANHPNTLMDAWVIGFVCRQPIYFMAKATFFNSPIRLWVLRRLNMIPVNRAGEGKTTGIENNQSFEECYQLLERNKTLVIFPEGSSFKERILRKLKTGAARIALDTEKRNGGKLGVQVIPLGINYSRPERFRSSILVSVGEPIQVSDYLEDYQKDFIQTSRELTEVFREKLEEVLVTTADKQQDYLLEQLAEVLRSKYLRRDSDDFQFLKTLRDNLYAVSIDKPEDLDEIRKLVNEIKWKSEQMAVKTDFLDRRFRSAMFARQLLFAFIGLVFAAPIYLYGVFHNIVQFKLTDILIPRITREIEYYAPLAVLIGLVIYPLSYFGFVVLLHQVVHLPWYGKVIYFWSLPVSGLMAYYLHRYLTHISFKGRYFFLMIDQREAVDDLKMKKERLRTLINL